MPCVRRYMYTYYAITFGDMVLSVHTGVHTCRRYVHVCTHILHVHVCTCVHMHKYRCTVLQAIIVNYPIMLLSYMYYPIIDIYFILLSYLLYPIYPILVTGIPGTKIY
jgi:hypothetical protein